jgi:5,10-methylenetetrahydromethanopterin reductase
MAVGTAEQCRAKVAEYIEAGVTCPILYPMMDDVKPVISEGRSNHLEDDCGNA